MAAVEQGAPLTTVDYDFWVGVPERQYVRFLAIARRQGGTIMARTLYELKDGTHVNVIFQPDGLQSFDTEFKRCKIGRIAGQRVRILPLSRVIASKKASNRDKDIAVLPILERTLRCARHLERKTK
ncbi:MAG: hypothetical protein EXS18_06680 [Verrucomicrobiae bacterium]|nr:hypothetical protein [Verrucomicrobiae bacterium]